MRVLLTLVILALAVGACGRKGDLEPPPGYGQENAEEAS